MVEGLTSSATDQGSVAGNRGSIHVLTTRDRRSNHRRPRRPSGRARPQPNNIQTQRILVTLAERPYPFPSRTRKLSSPAPKILRGQPFGKIGRRQDFCVSGDLSPSPRRRPTAGRCAAMPSAILGAMTVAAGCPSRPDAPPSAPTRRPPDRRPDAACRGPPRSPAIAARSARTCSRPTARGGARPPSRDHRCGARRPAGAAAADKQRRLA